jgi:hypothetical protein
MFVEKDKEYGTENIKAIVDESISNGYKGIIWDKLQKCKKKNNKTNDFFKALEEA